MRAWLLLALGVTLALSPALAVEDGSLGELSPLPELSELMDRPQMLGATDEPEIEDTEDQEDPQVVLDDAEPADADEADADEADADEADADEAAVQEEDPEEEAVASAQEAEEEEEPNHDADIKKMEAEEHAAALSKAATSEIPEEVSCYHDLVTEANNQKALAERRDQEARDAQEKLSVAQRYQADALNATHRLKRRVAAELKASQEAELLYREQHVDAIKTFDLAKGNLNEYQVERKKVDLDSSRSKQVLVKYLEYKKRFIEASASSEDPAASQEVQQYKKLSTQYLTSYHELQQRIKKSYTLAKNYSHTYDQLSQRYQTMAQDAVLLSRQVTQGSTKLSRTRQFLKDRQAEYMHFSTDAQKWENTLKTKGAGSAAAHERHQALSQQVHSSKVNYLKLSALAAKYKQLGEDARRSADLNKVRLFNFEQDTRSTKQEIKAALKTAQLLKRKYETAHSAGMVFTKAYRDNACEEISLKHKNSPALEAKAAEKAAKVAGQQEKQVENKVVQEKAQPATADEEAPEEAVEQEAEATEQEAAQEIEQADGEEAAEEEPEEAAEDAEPAEEEEEEAAVQQASQEESEKVGPALLRRSALELVQLGAGPEGSTASSEYTWEQCESDRTVAKKNLEAAHDAKKAHLEELTHLHILKEDHATAISGAQTAKAIMEGSQVKANKYLTVAAHAAAQAKTPCIE
eukprot:TRINITY_DN82_c0_g1_i1.p1 TRINITY_DN82_c0_g1~~TRINITY_DN82_c0_g1_i1.p1  ORF type:complete len:694 (+),score=303.99 TRINITY_DN82_c0_g1_i1:107-2188(+)